MKRLIPLASLALIALASCRPAPSPTPTAEPPTPTPSPTATPLPPPPTPTLPPTGITGRVEYTGSATGGILIFAQDRVPAPGESPSPTAISTFTDVSGEFQWDLPAGTYYLIAFLTIDRSPEGPPLPSEPLVRCAPIELGEDVRVNVEVVLTDDDIGGQDKVCVSG